MLGNQSNDPGALHYFSRVTNDSCDASENIRKVTFPFVDKTNFIFNKVSSVSCSFLKISYKATVQRIATYFRNSNIAGTK